MMLQRGNGLHSLFTHRRRRSLIGLGSGQKELVNQEVDGKGPGLYFTTQYYHPLFPSLLVVVAVVALKWMMGNSFKIRHPIISWEEQCSQRSTSPSGRNNDDKRWAWQGAHFAHHAHQHLVLIYHFVEECLLNKIKEKSRNVVVARWYLARGASLAGQVGSTAAAAPREREIEGLGLELSPNKVLPEFIWNIIEAALEVIFGTIEIHHFQIVILIRNSNWNRWKGYLD